MEVVRDETARLRPHRLVGLEDRGAATVGEEHGRRAPGRRPSRNAASPIAGACEGSQARMTMQFDVHPRVSS